MIIIRFLLYFTISFIILSVPVNNRTLFSYLHVRAVPYLEILFTEIRGEAIGKLEKSKDLGKKFFSNSTPLIEHDRIRSKLAAPKRKAADVLPEKMPTDDEADRPKGTYTVEEKELLRKILESTN